MKNKGIKVLIIALLLTALTGSAVYAAKCVVKKTEPYLTLEQDVLMPADMVEGQKYPVVFMTHNGYADKSAWGDFPEDIAEAGFITVNITWNAWDTSNVESAINYTLEKYADVIDKDKVVFLGGCHGGRDFVEIMSKENLPYTVKTAVLLSISEVDDTLKNTQKLDHVPLLVYYSTNDEYNLTDISKQFAEEVVTKPCRIKPQDDPAHGNNMVTTSKDKDVIRKGIIGWMKQYTK